MHEPRRGNLGAVDGEGVRDLSARLVRATEQAQAAGDELRDLTGSRTWRYAAAQRRLLTWLARVVTAPLRVAHPSTSSGVTPACST